MFEQFEDAFPHGRMELGGEIGTPAVDLVEWDGEFVITCDLPGFEEEDIDLRMTDNTLHLHAERKAERELEDEQYLHRERKRADVARSITLPQDVDDETVSASYEDGVLTITLPKEHAATEDSEGNRIPIS